MHIGHKVYDTLDFFFWLLYLLICQLPPPNSLARMEKLDGAWYSQHHRDDSIDSLQCFGCRNKEHQWSGPLLQPEAKQVSLNAV